MNYVRFAYQNQSHYGILKQGMITPTNEDYVPTGEAIPMEQVRLLAPCQPTKVVAVGLNYRDHAAELQEKPPRLPKLFLKPASSVIGPEEEIVFPSMAKRVDYEAELAIVIGKKAKHVSQEEALSYVLGYTCLNDVTARDLQSEDGQWTRAKSFDTFCPVGPLITDELDPEQVTLRTVLNGEIKQQGNTRDFLFSIPFLISFISQVMTLLPGDIITTGTPPGIGPMQPGDIVEIQIEGIGTLKNRIRREME